MTGGVPRLINVVCDSALLLGYSRELQVIGDDIIREAAIELRLAGSDPAPAGGAQADARRPQRGRRKTDTAASSVLRAWPFRLFR